LKKFKGSLGESPAVLLEAMAMLEGFLVRAQRVYMYAGFASAVDTTDQAAAGIAKPGRQYVRTGGIRRRFHPS